MEVVVLRFTSSFPILRIFMNSNAGVAANLSDLLIDLGNIPLSRVRTEPNPGTATEEDLLLCNANGTRCELVDGILVEKIMGWRESLIALALGRFISAFVLARNLGLVTGPDGMMRILKSQVRGPDVAFVSWGRLPGGKVPTDRVPEIVPDLAVEVLSDGNTYAEMARKRREYFHAGVRQVWMVDINQRTVAVYHDITKYEVLNETQSLVGGDVLPGFEVSLTELFGELDRTSPTAS
jgi:Uma2 family endonuclease